MENLIEGGCAVDCQCFSCTYNEECCGICEGFVKGCEPPDCDGCKERYCTLNEPCIA